MFELVSEREGLSEDAVKCVAHAVKYWTATDEQVAFRERVVAELGLTSFGTAVTSADDQDTPFRLYLAQSWSDHKSADTKVLAAALRYEGGMKAHAVAYLCGIRPRLAFDTAVKGQKALEAKRAELAAAAPKPAAKRAAKVKAA